MVENQESERAYECVSKCGDCLSRCLCRVWVSIRADGGVVEIDYFAAALLPHISSADFLYRRPPAQYQEIISINCANCRVGMRKELMSLIKSSKIII